MSFYNFELRELGAKWTRDAKRNPEAKLRNSSMVLKALEEVKAKYSGSSDAKKPYWINSLRADILVAIVIFLYAILVGVQVEMRYDASQSSVLAFSSCQVVFNAIFMVELGLRIRADGLRYCSPCNPLGFFDSVIIVLGMVDAIVAIVVAIDGSEEKIASLNLGPMRLLRYLRILRVLRIFVMFKELRLLIQGLFNSVSAVLWACLLLGIVMYFGSLFCCILLGGNPNLQNYFGSVWTAFYYHFVLVTMEGWPDISDAVIQDAGPVWAVYFVLFICISSMALLNLVTAVICQKLISTASSFEAAPQNFEANTPGAFKKDCEILRDDLRQAFEDISRDNERDASARRFTEFDRFGFQGFAELLEHSQMQNLFDAWEVSTDLKKKQLFELLDRRQNGLLDLEDLAQGILRVRGSTNRCHSLLLQKDLMSCNREEVKSIGKLEKEFIAKAKADFSKVEANFAHQLNGLEAFVESHRRESSTRHNSAAGTSDNWQNCWNAEALELRGMLSELDALQAEAEEALGCKQSL